MAAVAAFCMKNPRIFNRMRKATFAPASGILRIIAIALNTLRHACFKTGLGLAMEFKRGELEPHEIEELYECSDGEVSGIC
jgi:hypothetical protein